MVVHLDRELRQQLKIEDDDDGSSWGYQIRQGRVVVASPVADAVPISGGRERGHDHYVHVPPLGHRRIRLRLQEPAPPLQKLGDVVDATKSGAVPSALARVHEGVVDSFSLAASCDVERSEIHLVPLRNGPKESNGRCLAHHADLPEALADACALFVDHSLRVGEPEGPHPRTDLTLRAVTDLSQLVFVELGHFWMFIAILRPMSTLYVGGERHVLICELSSKKLEVKARLDVGALPSFLAFSPTIDRAYVVAEAADQVTTVSLGAEAPKPLGSAASPGGPAYVAVDRSGRWVLTANYNGGTVRIFRVDSGGELDLRKELRTGIYPHCIVSDPTNQYLFVPNKGTDTITRLAFDAETGEATILGEVSVESGTEPRHLTFSPDGHHAYLACEKGCQLRTFALDGGELRPLQTLSTLPREATESDTGADVHATPDGRFVYASTRGHDSIAIYRVAAGGLELVGFESTRGRIPRNFCLLGSDMLVAANQESGTLAVFSRDPELGTLEHVLSESVGEKAFWVGPAGGPDRL